MKLYACLTRVNLLLEGGRVPHPRKRVFVISPLYLTVVYDSYFCP